MLLGRTNSLDDLYHLDAALYRSLTNLKRFVFQEKGNVEDLDLYFDVSHNLSVPIHRIIVMCFTCFVD